MSTGNDGDGAGVPTREGPFARYRVNKIAAKFNGDRDVAAWIRQVRIAKRVMRLSGEDVADLASLSLRDKAFAVYEEMDEKDKSDFDRITEALSRPTLP